MIELLIGVPLTITAWTRGWKWWALLPLPAYFGSCYLAGKILRLVFGPGATQADFESAATAAVWGLLAVTVIILVVMIIKRKKSSTVNDPGRVKYIDTLKMFCPKCGREQIGNPNFCRGCGENMGLKSRYESV